VLRLRCHAHPQGAEDQQYINVRKVRTVYAAHIYILSNGVDFVMVYSKADLTEKASKKLIKQWQQEGGIARQFDDLKAKVKNGYYKATYHKFHAFHLSEYQRVIVMDADG